MADLSISVIMAIKNAERYLGEALDSILAQTYQAHEIIVVDGGSNDGSKTIAQSYPRTRYILQDGKGLPQAWNIGIAASTGQLITFLDSDDVWPRGTLAELMSSALSRIRHSSASWVEQNSFCKPVNRGHLASSLRCWREVISRIWQAPA